MPFLGGSLAFERYSVSGFETYPFGDEHIELLDSRGAGKFETSSEENIHVGFLGGTHVFDRDFDLAKNIIADALHCSVRIDTNQIPSSIRKAWLQMELAALAKDNTSGVPTKAQRKEAKEAVEQRCEVEAQSGKYKRMQSFPVLWDGPDDMLYFGGSTGTASGHCADLIESIFGVELRHVSAGTIAQAWGESTGNDDAIAECRPTSFVPELPLTDVAWGNEHSNTPDFLGNEFLMWLWWTLETETDTLTLSDDSEVVVMMNKTLTLECPRGESGKETISAECPIRLPEAIQAIRCGKLPRKTGLIVVREGQQFDLVLQAESFGISGAKIHVEDKDSFQIEDRINAIRLLGETMDLMFHVFCERRVSEDWMSDVGAITSWLEASGTQRKKKAA